MRLQIGSVDLTIKTKNQDLVTHIPSARGGWWPVIRESFAGAWQRSVIAPIQDALTHPTFWSCVTLIGSDIAKCCFELVKEDADGIMNPAIVPAFSSTLRRPNHYQNRIQFFEQWVHSKLCHGNTYVLKSRDGRGVVDALYILDASRVKPLQGPSGEVFYACQQDLLAGLSAASLVIPASEIIHDRWNTFYHPLVGLSPVYASGHLAIQGLKIISNATRLAQQGFQPGGVVTAATPISKENAEKFEEMWAAQYAGAENIGKIVVLGGGLKFEKPPVMTAVDAEIIKQLNWDDEKICSTVHVPGYMVNVGPPPNYNNIEALNQQYYSQCLQILIEGIELCLGEGIGAIDAGYDIEADVHEALLRMDSAGQMKFATDGVKGGIFTPNNARKRFNLPPVTGGDTVYLQEQDHSLEWLAKRDAQGPPPPTLPTPKPALPPAAKTISVDELTGAALRYLEKAS